MDDLPQNLSSLEAPFINPHNRLQNLSSVEEALRKERISLENEEPSMRISLGPEAAKLSALFIDAGEKNGVRMFGFAREEVLRNDHRYVILVLNGFIDING
ncbi:hypothetical protein HID58_002561 [Brassica napus]|uniref:Uncharacterized protein n=1 Tax=Brassica napus TaxID=3708 RepID=A0ABQ8EMV2_BRANA|nr:hypothetical protein HID58_002561 [Brassica napus]